MGYTENISKSHIKKFFKGFKYIESQGYSGKEAVRIFFDMAHCRRKFHSKPNEYFGYRFMEKNDSVRKNYILLYDRFLRYRVINDDKLKLRDKRNQYRIFADYIKREWIDVENSSVEEILEFVKKNGKAVFKPAGGSLGNGIFAWTFEEAIEALPAKFETLKTKKYICEQYLEQCDEMAGLNENSVNTTRIITFNNGKEIKIIAAGVRTGGEDKVCDNMSNGGVGAALDIEKGIVCTKAIGFDKKSYCTHPISEKQIVGFNMPFWDEAKELVIKCAGMAPTYAVLGWDIAYLKDEPCIIEVNVYPGMTFIQRSLNEPLGKEIHEFIDANMYKLKENKNLRKAYNSYKRKIK